MQLSAFGVNFHKACHHGIIMEAASNPSTELQAQGRIWRLGQLKNVKWTWIHYRDGFHACMEARNLREYAITMPAQGDIDLLIQEEARVAVVYKIIRSCETAS